MFVDIMTLVDRRWELKDPVRLQLFTIIQLIEGDANLDANKISIFYIFNKVNKHAKSKIQFLSIDNNHDYYQQTCEI